MPKPITYGIGPEFLRRDQLGEQVAPWEDGLRADTGPGSFEWWYFDAHFDDGSTAVIVFFTKPLLERRGPLKPAVQLTITRPDGQKLSRVLLCPPEQFSASRQGCNVHIGEAWVKGDLRQYELHISSDDLAAHLTFLGSVPPWRPGAGKNYYDTHLTRYFAWLPAIPYGHVSGVLTYAGQEHAVSGFGYHDHNWGNIGLNEVMSHWYWGRARLADYTLIFVEMTAAPAYGGQKIPVFLLAKGDRVLLEDGRPLELALADPVKHPGGREYPRQLDFRWRAAEGAVELRLRRPQVIEATSLLTLFSPWKRRLLRLVANPYYFRFNADLELTIDLPAAPGVQLQGQALYELMLLR